MDFLRLHHVLPRSRANGPGERAVLWVQGCTLGCPGCFNPLTHPAQAGELVHVDDLFDQVAALAGQLEGLTVSGGEPLQQIAPLTRLLRRVRSQTGLTILLFSGFTLEEIRRLPGADALLATLDVLLAGRYDQRQRVAAGLIGSSNKQVHLLTPRYTLADLAATPEAEVIISPRGEVFASGIHPPTFPPPHER